MILKLYTGQSFDLPRSSASLTTGVRACLPTCPSEVGRRRELWRRQEEDCPVYHHLTTDLLFISKVLAFLAVHTLKEKAVLRTIGRRIHEVMLFVALCASCIARMTGLIPIGDERYKLVRPEDVRIPMIGFSSGAYFCLGVFAIAFLFAGIGPIIFSPFVFFPLPLFLFIAIICRMVLESELRKAIIAEKKNKKDA